LLEHEAVAEAAVVPSPDPIRLAIPKAYVLLVSGVARSPATALSIFQHLHARLAPFKRIRRIELVTELPKTIPEKSAASSCAGWNMIMIAMTYCAARNSAKKSSRSCRRCGRPDRRRTDE